MSVCGYQVAPLVYILPWGLQQTSFDTCPAYSDSVQLILFYEISRMHDNPYRMSQITYIVHSTDCADPKNACNKILFEQLELQSVDKRICPAYSKDQIMCYLIECSMKSNS